MLDFNKRISYIHGNSCSGMSDMKPLLASVLRVKSQLATTRRIETTNGFFVLSRVRHTTVDDLVSVECQKRNELTHKTALLALCKRLVKTGKLGYKRLAHDTSA